MKQILKKESDDLGAEKEGMSTIQAQLGRLA